MSEDLATTEATSTDVQTVENGIRAIEFDFKGKRLKMRELDGVEGRLLMQINESTNSLGIDMALAGLVSIDGEALPPVVNESTLKARAKRFKFADTLQLGRKYSEAFNEDLTDPK